MTLTTDFGTADPFVGTMKGIILGANAEAAVVDITHEVPARDIQAGAFLFSTAYRYFPPQTIHVIVVDPGVGTSRRPIALRGPMGIFVCPDNGLLSYVLAREGGPPPLAADFEPARAGLPPEWAAYHLNNPRFWHYPLSDTFHGRDIFAPVAGHLSGGEPLASMGVPIDEVTAFAVPQPAERDGSVQGSVLHVDRFGNLITNIDAALIVKPDVAITIEAGGQMVSGLSTSYQDEGPLLGLIGSHGCLEVAVPNGNASEKLGLGIGDPISVRLG